MQKAFLFVALVSLATPSARAQDEIFAFREPPRTACSEAPNEPLREICRITNEERRKRRLGELVWDQKIARVAQAHASDMLRRNYFSHTTPEGRTWKDRLDRGRVPYMWSGENIAYGYETPAKFMEAWMRSRGHRENILHERYTRIGIGWAGTKVVQDFTDGQAKP